MLDYLNPDYTKIYTERAKRLTKIRSNPGMLPALFEYYKDHPIEFITDWGMTYDPMRIDIYGTSKIPFILFPRQREWIEWVVERWKIGERGICEKSRESGVSWLAVALATTLCLFNDGLAIGFGSRKESYVDSNGDMDSILEKVRFFISNLPIEFRRGWDRDKHSKLLKIAFPGTNSTIKGEAGDGIGRGGRQSIYFVDEAAFIERSHLLEASLSQTTKCRIDISTVNGYANSFAERRFSGLISVFTFSWRDDPRKDDAWYEKQKLNLDPVTLAQEVDINYGAAKEGIVIPFEWIQSAIGAHKKLGINVSGSKRIGFDVADEGKDKNALAVRYGILLEDVEEWSGIGSDIASSVSYVYKRANDLNIRQVIYDSDGLGAGVKGDSRIVGEQRAAHQRVKFVQFRGSNGVLHENKKIPGTDRTHKDYFANRKAQAWWKLRELFRNTHRAINGDKSVDRDEIISLNPDMKSLYQLTQELTQPTYSINTAGKIIIDKKPDGVKSPNLADAVMMVYTAEDSRKYSENDVNAVKNMFRK